ncbi:hypothetical protein [Saccharothrix obliqua]|uniref:hypothetical protein n=1 Tax=Saccharothrix obliqua TaxID=2861747 RepID=UPI001C5F0E20|nr:hypothetical protein [Saccharothrix obliqua]MBW4716898.1 hypothetical protein [Saccharothrix obliqua]
MRRALVAGLVVVLVYLTAPMSTAAVVAPAPGARPVTATQDFDQWYHPGGATRGSVTVSQTADLVRQRVKVSWEGLRPTRGSGVGASYPVVIMQCWGPAAQVTRERCWAAGRGMEFGTFNDATAWDRGLFGDFGDDSANLSTVMSFTARDGQRYSWDPVAVDEAGKPAAWPDGSVRAGAPPDLSPDTYNFVLPPTLLAETGPDGRGAVDIELLPGDQLPSLGCTDAAECSLVLVPIGDPHCLPDDQLLLEEWVESCKPGAESSSFRDASTWKTPTNWERRFAFPLSFRKTQQVCGSDSRPETSVTGSPYLAQLMASWRPRFCLDRGLFKLGYTSLGEGEARRQFHTNLEERRSDGVNAVLTARSPETDPPAPVVYAPVATTGFTVGFLLDHASGGEVTRLNLTPRLLLKMLTQSYTAAAPGIETHPAIAGNPTWWGSDPELLRANPGLELRAVGVAPSAYPLFVQGDLDLTWALTAYIAADQAATAWLAGAPDEDGMVVNPKYRAQTLPYAQFELRDDWRVPGSAPAYKDQLWFNLVANQVSSVVSAAVALVQARPTATTNETIDNGQTVYKRPERQQTGSRALLAITDLADTSVFGLRSAALRTPAGNFVQPDQDSMAFGLRATALDPKTGILTVDQAKLDGRAYPGTTVVYAGVPTSGLPRSEADNYATFLEYAAGPGQEYGTAVGNLPVGYLALSEPLRKQTREAAAAVRRQQGEVPPPPPELAQDPAGGLLPPPANPVLDEAGTPPAAASPVVTTTAPPPSSATRPVTSVATRADTSSFGRWLLPSLLGIGLLAGVLAPVVSAAGTPGHPVRRWAARLFRRGGA